MPKDMNHLLFHVETNFHGIFPGSQLCFHVLDRRYHFIKEEGRVGQSGPLESEASRKPRAYNTFPRPPLSQVP